MLNCKGNDKKDGPYTTGECPTIELALKELQLHIETFHERDLKKVLKCSLVDCSYETELLPNDSAVECLKLHVTLHHSNPSKEPKINLSRLSKENSINGFQLQQAFLITLEI